jgi:hypothetical protein
VRYAKKQSPAPIWRRRWKSTASAPSSSIASVRSWSLRTAAGWALWEPLLKLQNTSFYHPMLNMLSSPTPGEDPSRLPGSQGRGLV